MKDEMGKAEAKLDDLFPTRKAKQSLSKRKAAVRGKESSRTAATKAKRDALATAIEGGETVESACLTAGVSKATYEYYRRTDDQFRARVSVYRNKVSHAEKTWTGDSMSFSSAYFHHDTASPAFHADIRRTMAAAKPGSITLINTFPNSGKSALIEDFINETLALDPNHRFVVASKGLDHAKKILGTVKDRMTNIGMYPEYIGQFGPFYVEGQERSGRPWTTTHIKCAQVDSGERDYSVQAMGWKGQILGSRVDTIILDDIQTLDNLTQTDDMLHKFRQEYYTRLKGGRIIIIEPENHHDYPAVNTDGESLWPDRWPADEPDEDIPCLRKMRTMVGERVWWTMYMQKPQLSTNATFTEELVDAAKDWSFKVGSIRPGMPTILSIDPGLDPGITAITCLQYDQSEIRVVDVEQHNNFVQQEQILDLIESYAMRYRPQRVIIEEVAFQRALVRDDRLSAMSRKYGFIAKGHQTNKNKLDPILGVAAVASSFIREEIRIPWAGGDNQISAARMDAFCAELKAWRPGIPTRLLKQDYCMALWIGWLDIMEARHGMGIATDAWRKAALPWQSTSVTRLSDWRVRSSA
jgi:hypothetical protein